MSLPTSSEKPTRAWPWLLAAAGFFLTFRALGAAFLKDYTLDLGSLVIPSPLFALFLLVWSVFGTLALVSATIAIARVAQRAGAAETFARDWLAPSERRFLWISGGCAGALALVFHTLVLGGARLTDDEAAYHFAAQLLVRGQLSAPSHAAKEFFDNAFMINDGRLYAKYLLGWPLLLAPGVAINAPALMNPIYHGLTVPALYLILRQATDAAWARAGTLLFAAAPMLLVGAATLMSHTSCLCVLAWAWVLLIRSRRDEARLLDHLAFALLLALACFIRPTSAIGIGAPLALAWLHRLWTRPGRQQRVQPLLVFAAVGAAALAAMLAVNYAQTGDPLKLAYARFAEYEAVDERFTTMPVGWRHVDFSDPVRMLATTASGFLRLHFDLLGWPIGLLAAFLAVGDPRARLAWFAALGFALVHLPVTDMGVDSFGPVHWYEIALPVLVLCTLGFERTHRFLAGAFGAPGATFAPSLLAAAILCAWLGYMPVRVNALVQMATDITAPVRAIEQAGVQNAVVFGPRPWGRPCVTRTRNFVFFRPNNDPELQNSVLWVNHLSIAQDRTLMRHFPGRRGYVVAHRKECLPAVIPLDRIDESLARKLDQPLLPSVTPVR